MLHDARRGRQGPDGRVLARCSARGMAALASVWCLAATAAGPVGSAASWRDSCTALVDALRGAAGGDDMEVTYCVGQTMGIASALLTGSQIGAVSMASALTVAFRLNGDEVFQVFQSKSAQALLGVCMPEGTRTSEQVQIVYRYLEEHPEKGTLAAPAVFFEALSAAYPCKSTDTPAAAP